MILVRQLKFQCPAQWVAFFSFTNSKREINYAKKLGSDKADLSSLVRIRKYYNLFALMFLNHNKWKCNIVERSENPILLIKCTVIQKTLRLVAHGWDQSFSAKFSKLSFYYVFPAQINWKHWSDRSALDRAEAPRP